MLRAVLVDDERPALDELAYLLKKNSVAVIGSFQNTVGVLEFIAQKEPDLVFLDIELREMSGIDFGVNLQNRIENTAIIFVTAYSEYALEAFRAYPQDYITKPIDEERLQRTLRHLQETKVCRRAGGYKDKLYIRCFGKFEITCGNNKVKFPTKKTRELLAYLLCNEGTIIYRNDLARILFGNEDEGRNANNLRVTLFRVKNALREAGISQEQFLVREDFTLEIADGVCDILDFMRFVSNNPGINSGNIIQAEKIAGMVNGELFIEIDAIWITEKLERIMVLAEELFINMSVYYLSGGNPERAETVLLHLLALEPLSVQGYHRLLDLYMQTRDTLKYRSCFERYRKVAEKEYKERPLKFYEEYYKKCTEKLFKKTN